MFGILHRHLYRCKRLANCLHGKNIIARCRRLIYSILAEWQSSSLVVGHRQRSLRRLIIAALQFICDAMPRQKANTQNKQWLSPICPEKRLNGCRRCRPCCAWLFNAHLSDDKNQHRRSALEILGKTACGRVRQMNIIFAAFGWNPSLVDWPRAVVLPLYARCNRQPLVAFMLSWPPFAVVVVIVHRHDGSMQSSKILSSEKSLAMSGITTTYNSSNERLAVVKSG